VAVRAIVGLAGVALLAGAIVAVLASDGPARIVAGVAGAGCGLLVAGAVAAWRRSWQRGRQRRKAWGRLAWALAWVALAVIVGALLLDEGAVVLSAALGSLLLGSALLPPPSEQSAPPRFGADWTPLGTSDGRLVVHGLQLAVPEAWSAFRVPDGDDYADVVALLPRRRRLDLPIPMLAVGRLTGEAADVPSAEALVEQLRKPLGEDAPIEITSARARTAYVAGETALVLDVAARLADKAIPIPGVMLAVGKALVGIRPVSARVYILDRGAERWAIVWLGWSDGAARLNDIGESVLASLRWQE
jgi:hypothetical protein